MAWLAHHPALRSALSGLWVVALAAIAIVVQPGFVRELRNAGIDAIAGLNPLSAPDGVKIVDIDAASLAAVGLWPWSRDQLAKLISNMNAAHPSAVALDIVLSGNCGATRPANASLAQALSGAPVSLGFVLSDEIPTLPPPSPIAIRQPARLGNVWQSSGAELPCPEFLAAAAGLGTVSLAGDASAMIRQVPAVVATGSTLRPGLAIDALRIAGGGGPVIVTGVTDSAITVAGQTTHISDGGMLELPVELPSSWAARTISAKDILAGRTADLAGRIVIVGSSLPQLGDLRPTAASPLTSSAQIQAAIIDGMRTGGLAWRSAAAPLVEAILTLLAAGLSILAILRLRPVEAAAMTLIVASGLVIGSMLLYRTGGLIFDPVTPALGVLLASVASGIAQYAASRTAEHATRASFEQRLPATVVAQVTKSGANHRMVAEERVVTALFTDIEGYSGLTQRVKPQDLLPLLDGYFDGITQLISESGGIIDKIVGDAVHALFNAPDTLPDHPARALACAERIAAFGEDYRKRPDARGHGFGRTRIGIETGPAIVGDVGTYGKIDYSAHGPAINLAARLQEFNKLTGTTILTGPGLAQAVASGQLESLGHHDIRGLGNIEVFSPRREARA